MAEMKREQRTKDDTITAKHKSWDKPTVKLSEQDHIKTVIFR